MSGVRWVSGVCTYRTCTRTESLPSAPASISSSSSRNDDSPSSSATASTSTRSAACGKARGAIDAAVAGRAGDAAPSAVGARLGPAAGAANGASRLVRRGTPSVILARSGRGAVGNGVLRSADAVRSGDARRTRGASLHSPEAIRTGDRATVAIDVPGRGGAVPSAVRVGDMAVAGRGPAGRTVRRAGLVASAEGAAAEEVLENTSSAPARGVYSCRAGDAIRTVPTAARADGPGVAAVRVGPGVLDRVRSVVRSSLSMRGLGDRVGPGDAALPGLSARANGVRVPGLADAANGVRSAVRRDAACAASARAWVIRDGAGAAGVCTSSSSLSSCSSIASAGLASAGERGVRARAPSLVSAVSRSGTRNFCGVPLARLRGDGIKGARGVAGRVPGVVSSSGTKPAGRSRPPAAAALSMPTVCVVWSTRRATREGHVQ